MMSSTVRQRLSVTFACLAFGVVSGCSPTVQEDRTIEYSAKGESVAFQHGTDGVYVASSDGTKLEKVFDSAEALAVSSPLFSVDDSKMIFTTAMPQEERSDPDRSLVEDWEANPEGRRFHKMPIEYSCWLRNVVQDEQNVKEPVKIFSARLDHPGYVAANLAVRWHPSGDRILFLDQVDGNQVSLFEYNLQTQQTRRLIDKQASAMIFDWSSTDRYLMCSLLGTDFSGTEDGLLLIDQAELDKPGNGEAMSQQWRRVENSEWTTVARDSLSLDHLRKTRPAWTAEDDQFAFPSFHIDGSDQVVCSIYVVQPGSGQSKLLHQTETLVRDIRWQPNSNRLAFIEGETVGNLKLIDPDGTVTPPVNEFPVRSFAGWNFDGNRLSYISPDPIADREDQWTFLFMPIAGARDRVYVANGLAGGNAEMVHDKVRITFPKWSPQANEMSLWGTYSPTHRSVLSYLLPWTLRPGDPAATLDVDTKTIRWMAVNSNERSQVGHYYLMKRNYEEAWKWYEQAAEGREPSPKLTVNGLLEMAFQRRIHHDPHFFEYYCLWKLDRKAEAAERLATFKESMALDLEGAEMFLNVQEMDAKERAEVDEAVAFGNAFMQASYMTEVFLSLDAATDGITIFNELATDDETEDERLARLICQSQLMLASKRYQDYAVLVREEIAPFLHRLENIEKSFQQLSVNEPVRYLDGVKQLISGLAVCAATLPMASDDFVALLSDEEVHDSIESWAGNRAAAKPEEHRVACELVLRSLLRRGTDGDPDGKLEALRSEVDQRLLESPLFLPTSGLAAIGSVEDFINRARDFSAAMQ